MKSERELERELERERVRALPVCRESGGDGKGSMVEVISSPRYVSRKKRRGAHRIAAKTRKATAAFRLLSLCYFLYNL